MTTIRIRDLAKAHPGRPPVPALRGVDLDVADAGLTAVLGPSGCGKTTLLRALAGMERPDAGTIHVGDRLLDDGRTHLAPERRRVGLVPQEGALFPHLDVAANVAFGLGRTARTERSARVTELLALVGLAGFDRRRPHELSGGQQQRVALARALAPRPAVVLLDEPFSALDTALRATLRDQVAEVLRTTGTTAILVTHDQDEALSLADQVAIMREGRIIQTGSPIELYRRPIDRWTAGFLGDALLLPGRRVGAAAEVDTVLGRLALDPDADHHADLDATVLVRPEQVVRDPAGAVTASVEGLRFRGSEADVTLRIGTTELGARWPSTELPAIGSSVTISVRGPVVALA